MQPIPRQGRIGTCRNKTGSLIARKPASKPLRKIEKCPTEASLSEEKNGLPSPKVNSVSPKSNSISVPSVLRRHEQLLHSNLSLNASCSSNASTDSFHSRASTGDPSYVAFHDEEWGVPVHDDKKLFELLVLAGALSELTWPDILRKRHIFREVFMDFDPVAVSKLNEKKLIAPGDEFGSLDSYIWSFVHHKPIVSRFRYPRQVPVKTPKADVISKDLIRRGFRSVGPTVIYSFMQVAGMTNDHFTSCFRFQDCINAAEGKEVYGTKDMPEEKKTDNMIESELSIAIDELSFSQV
ncbi:26S proteasome non-ATPase regulatory subunit 9-like [Hibiscus syriacus]|uniref:26S proteasome non-ATPase regulatory subunit 9-like n=1 Tax=Hibiscus syriacus TaxID=106335 RepID=A0A6A3D7J9_HIBSY|nr:26S proteasome non-ATPase regulatory subunit 9-like [Hibiscus syriacus]